MIISPRLRAVPRPVGRLAAVAVALASVVATAACSGANGSDEPQYTVAITHISRLSVIDDNVDAFKKELAAKGFVEGKNVKYVRQDANGQRSNISLLARSIVDEKPDLIYALGTDLNLALKQLTKTPTLFGLTTDPVGVGLIDDVKKPGANLSGTSDYIDPKTYFDYLQLAVPDAKTVGLVGNVGESNTASQIKLFKAEATQRGLKTVTAPVPTTNEIVPSLRSLKGRVDVILIGADSTLSSADEVVIRTATDAKIPVVFNGSGEAEKGALVGIGPDYVALGKVSGDQAAEVLKGKKAGDLSVAYPGDLGLISASVNTKVADQLGLTISEKLAAQATQVGK